MNFKKLCFFILLPLLLIPVLIKTKKKIAERSEQSSALVSKPAPVVPSTQNPVKTDVPGLAKQAEPKSRTVTIKSTINHDMLGYKHWTGHYHPTTFNFSINDVPFEYETEARVTVENNKLYITYYYEFLNGMRKGGRTLEFEIPATADHLTMSFDWKNKQHVLFDNAQWLGEIDEKPAKSCHKKKVA